MGTELPTSIDIDASAGGVRVTQPEVFRGPLAPVMAGSLRSHTLPDFEAMNEALKQRVERAPAAQSE